MRCSFCSVPRFYGLETSKPLANGPWLARSEENVSEEILDLYNRFRLQELLIVDEEFFGGSERGQERATTLADRLEALHLPTRFALSARAENIQGKVLDACGSRPCIRWTGVWHRRRPPFAFAAARTGR
jgi:radical SAM superfamily enzyme YgiQ (UPF0313 family)